MQELAREVCSKGRAEAGLMCFLKRLGRKEQDANDAKGLRRRKETGLGVINAKQGG